MKRSQQGFTLIELVVVVVLLGIVGAVATAKFQDLSTKAESNAVEAVAGELSSASAINYAASQLTPGSEQVDLSTDTTCDSALVATLFQSNALPNGYSINNAAVSCTAAAAGTAFTCQISRGAATANATVLCTG